MSEHSAPTVVLSNHHQNGTHLEGAALGHRLAGLCGHALRAGPLPLDVGGLQRRLWVQSPACHMLSNWADYLTSLSLNFLIFTEG